MARHWSKLGIGSRTIEKALAVLATLVVAFCFLGCGQSSESASDASPSANEAVEASEQKPEPETIEADDSEPKAETGSAEHPKEYFIGDWISCGFEIDGVYTSFNDLSREELRYFPYFVLNIGENISILTPFVDGKGAPNGLYGESFITPKGVTVDGNILDEARSFEEAYAEFLMDGDNLTLQLEDMLVYFEKLPDGGQLTVSPVEFDCLTLEVPYYIAYFYCGVNTDGKNSIQIDALGELGLSMDFFSNPTDAQDIIELADEDFAKYPEDFISYNGVTYLVQRSGPEFSPLAYTRVCFVANGKYYEIVFNYDEEACPYSTSLIADYAAKFYTTIQVDGTASSSRSTSSSSVPSGAISWQDAYQHVGEWVTIYGPVAEVEYAPESNGQPTFFDLGVGYPDERRVTMIIWGEDRDAFPASPQSMYSGKTVCVTGELYMYEGICFIKVASPSQVQVL